MKYFLDNVWYSQGSALPNIGNTEEEKLEIKQFVRDMFQKKDSSSIASPPISDSGDLQTIGYACEVLVQQVWCLLCIKLTVPMSLHVARAVLVNLSALVHVAAA